MNFCLALLIAFTSSTDDYCGNFPPKSFGGPGEPRHTRSYSNYVYGYSVKIPKGLTGYSTPPPAPQHGFGIVLSWEPRAYIYFDGSYNATEAKDVREIEQMHLKWVAEKSAQVNNVRKYAYPLGRLQARRYVAEHTCQGVKGVFVDDEVIALHDGVIYSATLLTTQERYSQDKGVLEQMIKTWRLSLRE